jgi:hypothetical protein
MASSSAARVLTNLAFGCDPFTGVGMSMVGGFFGGGFGGGVGWLIPQKVHIVGFRGVGFNPDRYDRFGPEVKAHLIGEHGLIKAGHVGISFNRGRTIYGFFPTDEAMAAIDREFAEGIEWVNGKIMRSTEDFLKEEGALMGQVRDDTWVFKLANELAGPTQGHTALMQKTIAVSRGELLQMHRQVLRDVQAGSQRFPPQWYRFPSRDGSPMPLGCNNCATWPRTLGISLPENSGNLRSYLPQLDEIFESPWR